MRLPIRRKLILFIALPAAVIYGLAALFTLRYAKETATIKVEADMAERATSFAARFDDFLRKATLVPQATAGFLETVPELDEAQVGALVRRNVEQDDRFFGAAIAFEPGTIRDDDSLVCPYAFRTEGGIEIMNIDRSVYDWFGDPRWEWWHAPRTSGQGHWTAPYFDEGAGNVLMTTYSAPFRGPDGSFRGVATVDINLQHLQDEIANAIVGNLEFVIITQNGRYIYTPDVERILKADLFDDVRRHGGAEAEQLARHIASGTTGVHRIHRWDSHEPELLAHAPISSTGWELLVSQPESEAFELFRQRRAGVAAALAGALGLTVAGILFMANRISRPIAVLSDGVRRIAEGEAGAHVDHLGGSDEIGELARGFGIMQQRVADREEKLRHSRETTLHELLESAPDAMIIADHDGRIRRTNRRTVELFGFQDDEIAGRTLEELVPGCFRIAVQGSGSTGTRDPLRSGSAASGGAGSPDLAGRRADGSTFPVEIGWSPFHDPEGAMVIAAVRDITVRRENERALRESEERFRTLVDNLPGTVYRCRHDHHWTMLFVSDTVEALTGFPAADFIDNRVRSFDSIIHPDDRAKVAERVRKAIAADRPWEIEYRIVRPDGTVRWVGESGRAIRGGDGSVACLDGVILDITRRKEIQSQLHLAREQAEAANRAKSEFLSNMSHELRTPLNGVLGYAQILQRDPHATADQRESLEAIINCGDHLLALINDVLDLSKIEAGRIDIDLGPTDLHKLVKSVGDIVGQRAAAKGIAFETDVAPEVPHAIVTDASKLRQILVNLLGNAVKFTSRGGVTLRLREPETGTLAIEVVDTGVGIAAHEIEEIFDPFKQVEAGKAAGGTGLGLSITKRLTEMLEGRLEVDSTPGEGSTFRVVLPFEETELPPPAEPGAGEETIHGDPRARLAPGQAVTVLIADDRETNRDILERLLEPMGFTTVTAENGEEALAILRKRPVDVVLLDIRMPVLNGIETVRHIREAEDPALRDTLVLAVTASVFPDFQDKAIEAGFDDFLGKPLRTGELIKCLHRHLGLRFVVDEPEREPAVPEDPSAPVEGAAPDASPAPSRSPEANPGEVSDELRDRLERALAIRSLTAIKAIGRELVKDASTRALGERIGALAQRFDFHRLREVCDQLKPPAGDASAPAAPPAGGEASPAPDLAVAAIRLREALRIRNVTAITRLAGELKEIPATRAFGESLARHARAFDFATLTVLAEQLDEFAGRPAPS